MDTWFKDNVDLKTIAPTLLLLAIGVASVYSATYDAGASMYFNRQLIWTGIGILLMLIIMVIPFRTLQLLSYPLYGFSILLLIVVLIAGKMVAGSKSWFGVAGFGLQPSEIVKATTILALASYLSERYVNLNRFKHLSITLGFVLLPVLLIVLQPDVGTAIIYLGMLVIILYWAGASNFLMMTMIAPFAAVIATLFGTTPFLIVIAVTFVTLFLLRQNRLAAAMVFSLTVLMGVSVQYFL